MGLSPQGAEPKKPYRCAGDAEYTATPYIGKGLTSQWDWRRSCFSFDKSKLQSYEEDYYQRR
jgi:hypothetical protein